MTCWCAMRTQTLSMRFGVTWTSFSSVEKLRRAGLRTSGNWPGCSRLHGDCGLPEAVVELDAGCCSVSLGVIDELDEKIDGLDRKLRASAREVEETAQLMTIPGIGPITALANPGPSHRRW